MVEAGAKEVSEDKMLEAIAFGHEQCRRAGAHAEGADGAGRQAALGVRSATPASDLALASRVRRAGQSRSWPRRSAPTKSTRAPRPSRGCSTRCGRALGRRRDSRRAAVRAAFEEVESAEVRRMIVERGLRVDGRKVTEIRPISIEVAYLPRAHGSSLFTRGETQALVSATLGTKSDEQKIEALEGESYRHFMLHYNFPSFSVGEVRRFGSPSRRDIGHGALAERAVEAVLPAKEDFPYTIRVVSDILESNGSSSMASVCGASLALMDAGVPIKSPRGGHRHGAGEGRRQVRDPHRHHGHRGPLRRHGLQGRRHREGRHRAADGHQDHRACPSTSCATRSSRPAKPG